MRNLRAAATAILLGTAALGAGAALQPAFAALSAAVGKPLQEAQSLAAAGKYREAMDRANAAAAAAKTPEEHQKTDQMKQYIAVKSGDASIGGALGAKAKFANDASAGRWKDVIADGDALAKNNAEEMATLVTKRKTDAERITLARPIPGAEEDKGKDKPDANVRNIFRQARGEKPEAAGAAK